MTRSKQNYVLMAAAIVALTAMVLMIPTSAATVKAQCFGNPHDDGPGQPHDFRSGPNGNPHDSGFGNSCPGQGTDQNPNK